MTSIAYRYNVRLDRERDLAMENARERRAQARILEAAGQRIAADFLRAAARMYDDSALYWDQELSLAQRDGAQTSIPKQTASREC